MTIAPDGPSGPARVLKKGVLQLALKSGTPIVPLTITASRFIAWPSWDSKRFPLPFNRIRVRVHQAISASYQNFDEFAGESWRSWEGHFCRTKFKYGGTM